MRLVSLAGAIVIAGSAAWAQTPATTGSMADTFVSLYRAERSADVKETILRQLADRGATRVLVDLYDSEKEADLRETILRLLADRDDEIGRAKVLAVAKSDPDADLRETAIRHLADRGNTKVLVDMYDTERDADVKEAILRRLADRDDETARQKIAAIVKGPGDMEMREAAVGLMADHARIDELIKMFDAEKASELREVILRRLADSGDARATQKLLDIAKNDPDDEVRQTAIRRLAERAIRDQR